MTLVARDRGDQVADVAARQLGRGVEAGDDRADQLQAVAVQVVAEGVVVGDHLLVGQAVDLPLDLGVERPQLLGVGGQVGLEAGRPGRLGGGQAALDVGRHDLGVAGALPDVGVGLALDLAQRHPLAGVDHRAVVAGALDGVAQPLLQADPVLEDQVGAGQGVDVGRGGLVVVGVDARLEQAGHLDAVAADVGRQVGHLGGGGHHLEPLAGGVAVAARSRAASGQQEHQGQQAGGQERPRSAGCCRWPVGSRSPLHGPAFPVVSPWAPSYRFWQ